MTNKKNIKDILLNNAVIIVMVVLVVITGVMKPNFLTMTNFTNIFRYCRMRYHWWL